MPIIRTSGNKIPPRAEQEETPTFGSPALGEMDTVLKGSGLGRLDIKDLRKRARHPVLSSLLKPQQLSDTFWKKHTGSKAQVRV